MQTLQHVTYESAQNHMDSRRLGYSAVSTGKYLLTFRKSVVPGSSGTIKHFKLLEPQTIFLNCLAPKIKPSGP